MKDTKRRYQAIKELSNRYKITLLCEISKVSRSGYYKWLKRKDIKTPKQAENEKLKRLIMACYKKLNGIFGYPRIKIWLMRNHGLVVNHKRVYRLMKELGIKAVIRKKRKYFTGPKENVIAKNIINRDFKASSPNEKWVTDITYLIFNQKRLYLSAIKDLFNNEIIAYKISDRNDLKLVLDTVIEAKKKRDVKGTILHSDQGCQYTSRKYHKLLQEYGITPSMSRRGNCIDNASMENFFSHLKTEVMYINKFRVVNQVEKAIIKYMRFYNSKRYQRKLNNLSPIEYRAIMTK